MPKKTEQKIGFTEGKYNRLIPYLNVIKRRINKLDYDCFIVITGKERRGKSTLAYHLGHFLSDGKMNIDFFCMSVDEFTKALQNCKKGDVIVFDEAGTNLYSREAMTTMNRMLTKAFMISGLKNVAIIFCIPSFFSLDSYIRNHRIDLLFHVPVRGKFKCFSTKRAKKLSILGAKWKSMSMVKANVFGSFVKTWQDEEFRKAYKEKETKYKNSFIKDLKKNLDGYYSTTKFCQVTGYHLKTVYDWIQNKEVEAKKVGRSWFIPRSEADRVVREHQSSWKRKSTKDSKEE